MARIKIDYGIDLGTTNSAIARMENGESVIKQTKNLMDTLPSCVYFSKEVFWTTVSFSFISGLNLWFHNNIITLYFCKLRALV